MQRAIDSESANAAVEDADGKRISGISDCEFRIELKPGVQGPDFKFAIRKSSNSEIQDLVEAPGIEPGSKANAEGLYMLICFSFRSAFRLNNFRPSPSK